MKLEILYGRAGSGKTHECVRRVSELVGAGEKCIMLVPEQFSYRTEKLLVGLLGATSSETAEVLTFTRLAGRIFAQKSGAVRMPLSGAGKNMLIYRAVLSVKNKLQTYSLAAEKQGFADKLSTIISEFKRYGISCDDVAELSKSANKPALASKLADLALIYKKYDELFLDDYSDFEDNLYIAAQLLEQSDYLQNVHIFIDEFTDFLPQHYKMLSALCGRVCDITVCLCADKALGTHGIFAPAAKTFFKLKNMCAAEDVNFSSVYMSDNLLHEGNDELLHLEKNFEKIGGACYDGATQNIAVFESLNVYSEIENAARHVLSLARQKGVRWRDITVCCGDSETYFEPVKMIFERYNIPCFLAEKSAVSSHPLVLTILSAIDIFINGYSYESMFTYLKTGFSNIDARECDLLENYVLATGASKRAWLDEKPWRYKSGLSEDEAEENLEIDEIRRRVVAPLVSLRENIGSKHTAKHACEAVYAFVCELDMGEKVEALIEKFKETGELVNANRYARIWNCIIDILDQVVLTTGEKKIGMEQLRNLLATGFSKEQMGIIPQSADAVSVVDVPNARAQQCDYMVLLGTNTGTFVGNAAAEGILTDGEREAIETLGVQLAPTARASLFDARFLIYKAVTRPRKELFLSYAVAGMDGKSLPESEVCRNVKNIFPNVIMDDDITGQQDAAGLLGSPESTFGALAAHMDSENYDGFWRQVYKWYESKDEYSYKLAALNNALSYKNAAMTLSQEQVKQLYPYGINTSVSRLERYSKCPFSYFIEFTLKAKERKVLKIGAPDIGTIMHAVLERFTKQIKHDNMRWDEVSDEYVEATITAIIDDMSGKMFYGSALMNKSTQYILLRLKRNLVSCAKLVIMHIASGRFEPVGSEVTFGDDGEINAYVIDLTSGKKLRIRGVIDRIDKCESPDGTYYRVIDYKSGNKTFSLENIYNKLDLQLVVYLDAAMQNKKNAKPAGMLYFNIREPMSKVNAQMSDEQAEEAFKNSMKLDGLVLSDIEVVRDMDRNIDEGSKFLPVSTKSNGDLKVTNSLATMSQFKVLCEYVKHSLKQIGDSIAGGNIDIMPYRKAEMSPCSYCAYKSVCKFDASNGGTYRMCKKAHKDEMWQIMNSERGE